MLKKGLALMLVLFAVGMLAVGCGGGSSDDDSGSTNRFVGKWQLTDAGTGARTADIQFNANGTLFMYEAGSPNVKADGTYTASGNTAAGRWETLSHSYNGTIGATLTDDTHMDFLFGENKYTPIKIFPYKGVKVQ